MAIRGILEQEPVREFSGDPRTLAISLLRELTQERARLVEELARIECKTFDEYRSRKGRIDGVDIAISLCKTVQGKLEA